MKYILHKIKQLFCRMNLQARLMSSYLAIICLPLLIIAVLFYGKVYSMIVSDTVRSQQEQASQIVPAIGSMLQEITAAGSKIRQLPFFRTLLDKNNWQSSHTPDGDAFSQDVQTILRESPLSTVRIYIDLSDEETDTFRGLTGDLIVPMEKAKGTYWKGIFSGTDLNELHCPSFYLSPNEIEHYGDMAYIVRCHVYLDGQERTCFAAFYYSSELVQSILHEHLPSEESVSYLINDRDALIATSNPSLSSMYFLSYDELMDPDTHASNFLMRNTQGEEIYASSNSIPISGWFLVTAIPSGLLTRQSRMIALQYILMFALFISFALVIAVLISRSITGRLARITHQMSAVRNGPPIPLEQPEEQDELGTLISTYNYMCEEMNDLIHEQEKTAEELRLAEFNSLQAQINPHFLYNTLDMIKWLAFQNRTDEIAEAVQNLSRFYKLTLSKKMSISTIDQELEHVSLYIRLQNMRFCDTIDLVIDIPDELLEYQIPKLTLQPIVENALLHGILEAERKQGCIVITGWTEDGCIDILISDDGAGIAPEKLPHILDTEGSSRTGSHIGVYNTHHRLQLLYGKDYGLSYQSTQGQGTEVTIHLPAITSGKIN